MKSKFLSTTCSLWPASFFHWLSTFCCSMFSLSTFQAHSPAFYFHNLLREDHYPKLECDFRNQEYFIISEERNSTWYSKQTIIHQTLKPIKTVNSLYSGSFLPFTNVVYWLFIFPEENYVLNKWDYFAHQIFTHSLLWYYIAPYSNLRWCTWIWFKWKSDEMNVWFPVYNQPWWSVSMVTLVISKMLSLLLSTLF